MTALRVACVLLFLAGCYRAGPIPDPPAPLPQADPELADWAEADAGEDLADLPPPPVPEDAEDAARDPLLYSPSSAAVEMEQRTRSWIHFWQTRGREYFERYLERMGRYEVIVDRALEERGLPPSLRYLPLVESGYNPHAVSRVGATGMWQLMAPTARDLDVYVDPLLDERRDPWIATEAALDYLEELHAAFGSWFLALAAYNAGRGRVRGILSRHAPGEEPSDALYVALRRHFPAETREFVPRFFAAARIASDPEAHGFDEVAWGEPVEYDEVRVPDATSIDVLARAAGVDEDELSGLNPQLRRGLTPANRETVIRVPAGRGARFEARYAAIPPDERVSFTEHRIAAGETLTHVARAYGVALSDLRAANPGVDPTRLQIGQRLVVPVAPAAGAGAVAGGGAARDGGRGEDGGAGGAGTGEGSTSTVVHTVGNGESLWSIARSYGVTVSDLRRWNGLGENPVIHPGDEIEVRQATETRHRVARGETLIGIAARYGVPVSAIVRANGISRDSVIRAGEELRIPLR